MKRLACLLLACLTALSLTACGAPKAQEVSLFAMDTYMTLSAYGDSAEEALAAASREINRLESTLSRTIAASDVSRLNAGETVTVQKETRELLERALALSDETGGAFDMTVAPLVSLWGITSDAPHVPSQEEIDALLPLVGSEHVHMDGSIVSLDAGCAVDLGGRPYFVYDAAFAGQSCGGMDTQMAREFFYAVSYSAMMNLHLKVLYGENDHHKLEAMFKAFAKALDAATRKDARIDGVLSTKGTL